MDTVGSMTPEDGWTTVTRGPRRRKLGTEQNDRKKTQGMSYIQRRIPCRGNVSNEKDIQTSLCEQVIAAKSSLSNSHWWLQMVSSLNDAMGSAKVEFVQCLGLGSFQRSEASRHQLACAILLRERFGNVPCTVADPIMTAIDAQIIERLGLIVAPARELDHVEIQNGCGLLFMPHCEEVLNNHILSLWLSRPDIANLVLLGNTLSCYIREVQTSPLLSNLTESGRLVERNCLDPKTSTLEVAFNHLSVTNILPG